MRQNQSQQSTDTGRMAESAMNQGQETMEQLIDLQRNMARMTLSAIKWQETAQQQGLEMTKSLLENTPGPRFTESMMESYLQGVEAMMPEMEQVMEQGFEAAAQPQMAQMEDQMQAMGQQPGHGRTSEQGIGQRTTGHSTGQQPSSRQPTGRQMGQQGQTQPQQQYSETGEWISPAEYGGESAGTTRPEQQPMTATPTQTGQSQPQPQPTGQSQQGGPGQSREESGRAPPTGQFEQRREQEQPPQRARSRQPQETQQTQTGGPNRGGEQALDQPTRQQQSSRPRTGQGRSPEGSQRIDTDRREQGEQGRSTTQTGQGQTGQSAMRGPGSERTDERNRSERHRTDEMSAMEEMNISTEGSPRTTRNRGEDRSSEQE